ncbi:MAG: EF-hand domain-containing protein [Alphaproteobacteria bacterium]|nr:EF-hand domain-containing protein [Alphaproteobacteria bacterium]
MKKFLMLSALALAVSAAPVFAQDGGPADGGRKGPPPGAKMFEKHDVNGDGVVDETEFLKGAEERFKMMDTDGDGKITQDEAKAHRDDMREKMHDRHEKMKDKRGHGGPEDDAPESE